MLDAIVAVALCLRSRRSIRGNGTATIATLVYSSDACALNVAIMVAFLFSNQLLIAVFVSGPGLACDAAKRSSRRECGQTTGLSVKAVFRIFASLKLARCVATFLNA